MTRWPLPLVDTTPKEWPEMVLWAATVLLEAEGESDRGKLAVAWVIKNRMERRRQDARTVVLTPWAFSCWNADASPMRRARLIAPDAQIWDTCWWAVCGTQYGWLPDPTNGADHYLNVPLTKIQRGGTLPPWYDAALITADIDKHTFLHLIG